MEKVMRIGNKGGNIYIKSKIEEGMMDYTKGKWSAEEIAPNEWAVMQSFTTIVYCDSDKANAYLIAAAPMLCESGRNALVSLKLWADEHPDDEVLAMVITQLEYALAKAGGGR